MILIIKILNRNECLLKVGKPNMQHILFGKCLVEEQYALSEECTCMYVLGPHRRTYMLQVIN
jgi:hypothetical protein